jgi:hypothetical protein
MTDRDLLLEAFGLLYVMYKDQHGGRRYYRPVSIYPTLSRIKNRLEKTMTGYSPAGERRKVNSPWT